MKHHHCSCRSGVLFTAVKTAVAKVEDFTMFRILFKRNLYQFNACILNNFCTRVASAWKVQYLVLHVDRHAFDTACIVFNNCPIFRLDDEDLWCTSSHVTRGTGFKVGGQAQKQEKSTTKSEAWKLAPCEVTWARSKTRQRALDIFRHAHTSAVLTRPTVAVHRFCCVFCGTPVQTIHGP